MLYSNLNHIESAEQHSKIINENENVMIICGRMGSMSVPVYRIASELENEFSNVKMFDMEFDNPESLVIRDLPEVTSLMEIPFTIYYKNGQLLKATAGIQSKEQITAILNTLFKAPAHI